MVRDSKPPEDRSLPVVVLFLRVLVVVYLSLWVIASLVVAWF